MTKYNILRMVSKGHFSPKRKMIHFIIFIRGEIENIKAYLHIRNALSFSWRIGFCGERRHHG